mgnify:CR=1 FL=1
MRKLLYSALAVVLISPTTSFAKDYTCVFSSWKGATDEDASISWVGTSFIASYQANSSSGKIKKVFPKESTGWIAAKALHTKKFTTLKYQSKRWDDKSRVEHMRRFSFRIYNNGKCQATVATNGFTPVIASGRW